MSQAENQRRWRTKHLEAARAKGRADYQRRKVLGLVRGPERARELRRKYDVSVVWLLAQWQCQDGKCAVCSVPAAEVRRLNVDHDHETGKARGLLCDRCNAVVGTTALHANYLRRAAAYVETYSRI